MKHFKLLFISLLCINFLSSCSDDDTFDPVGEKTLILDNGFFVLNEGSGGEGSVTYISNDLQTVEQNVFAKANPEEELGLGMFLQSIFFHEDKAYIISNGSNLITVVNRYTFELLGKVTSGLEVPRYGVVENGKAYITNQADFSTSSDDFVAVVNLETLEVETTILTNAPVEFIEEENGKLYIQNSSYGVGNQISVFDPATNSITATISVAEGLNSFEIEDNILYALTKTKIQTIDLSSLEVSTLVDFSSDFTTSNLEVENGQLFYTSENKVYSMAVQANQVPADPLIEYETNSEYGMTYGFAAEDEKIYIADAGDFASNSKAFVYDIDGTLLQEIPVGVAPNGFYFNE